MDGPGDNLIPASSPIEACGLRSVARSDLQCGGARGSHLFSPARIPIAATGDPNKLHSSEDPLVVQYSNGNRGLPVNM
jgi:hypothetical protein